MTSRSNRSRWRLGRLGLGLGALAVSWLAIVAPAVGSDGTEFACEEATAHLQDCCPGFDASKVECLYAYGCDGSGPVPPTVSREQSECIEAQSCDELRTNGNCTRITAGQVIQCN